jgi:hypothetical protein
MIAGWMSIKKVFLELEGKSAFVVLDDVDIASAAARRRFSDPHSRRAGLPDHDAVAASPVSV